MAATRPKVVWTWSVGVPGPIYAAAVTRVEQELASPRAARRLRAAVTLASLGKRQRLAPRLADQSPLVRASLACRLAEAS